MKIATVWVFYHDGLHLTFPFDNITDCREFVDDLELFGRRFEIEWLDTNHGDGRDD